MALAESGLNVGADAIGAAITHIGLVDETGTELAGGTYARKAVTWTAAVAGLVRPNADIPFDVPGGNTVGGWRGFTALTAGTNHGGADVTQEVFAGDGTYTLLAAQTAIDLDAV